MINSPSGNTYSPSLSGVVMSDYSSAGSTLRQHKLCQAAMVRDLCGLPWAALALLLTARRTLGMAGRFASAAAANILGPAFHAGGPSAGDLQRVQRRRELPTRLTQFVQIHAVGGLYSKSLADDRANAPPPAFQLFRLLPRSGS